jgi:hypothetical protein
VSTGQLVRPVTALTAREQASRTQPAAREAGVGAVVLELLPGGESFEVIDDSDGPSTRIVARHAGTMGTPDRGAAACRNSGNW